MPSRSLPPIGLGAVPGRSPPSCRGGNSGFGRRLAALCCAAGLAFSGLASAAPHIPTDDTIVVEKLPFAANAALRRLRLLNDALRRDPKNLALALLVAARDHEIARAEADPRYDGYAEAALAPWIALDEPPTAVLLLRATLRQSRHDFAASLLDLDRVLAATPRNAQAWLTKSVVLQVEGDYPQALASCGQLRQIAEKLVFQICDTNVRSLGEGADAASQALDQALDNLQEDASLKLWALTLLGETAARRGDPEAAEAHFKRALALGIEDCYLLGAYADFLLDQGRPAEIRTLLAGKERIDPLMLRLALADAALNGPDLARNREDLTQRFADARRRGDLSHLREQARFTLALLGKPEAALMLAQANWTVQREPWDARLLLEAALAAHRPGAARPALDWLAKAHIADTRLRALAERLESPEK